MAGKKVTAGSITEKDSEDSEDSEDSDDSEDDEQVHYPNLLYLAALHMSTHFLTPTFHLGRRDRSKQHRAHTLQQNAHAKYTKLATTTSNTATTATTTITTPFHPSHILPYPPYYQGDEIDQTKLRKYELDRLR